ncbi:hypothetical protein AC578_7014 [Pseudocercospora eumusae]|uniref:Uncharacterized protein n=1 Tax=Pseudocercospora eumusae TaxID=321146 RepID=A0A139HCM9_9PEZI|nr:hypothetical protein AC578_7014 [Pseudocercospora eumusae]
MAEFNAKTKLPVSASSGGERETAARQAFRRGNQLHVIRDEGRIGEEATSPEYKIRIPRSTAHEYKQQHPDSEIMLPLYVGDKYYLGDRVQQSVTTHPGGQAQVIPVIRSHPNRRKAARRRDRRRRELEQEEDENTPLAHFLPLRQYIPYAFANVAKRMPIVKPFVPGTEETIRVGRANNRVRYRQAPSIRSQEAVSLDGEVPEEYHTVAAPVNEYLSVEQRCNAFRENPDITASPDQPDKHPVETSQTTGYRAKKNPARYRRRQQPESQNPRATVEAAETKKSGLQRTQISNESVLKPGWSSTFQVSMRRDALGEEPVRRAGSGVCNADTASTKLPVGRQTSLLPGWWSKVDEENKLSGGSFSNRQHFRQRIHRHDSRQLQELLPPKRGYEARAVQDARYPRVVSLERDLTWHERPAWTKIGHHAILSSWQQGTEPGRKKSFWADEWMSGGKAVRSRFVEHLQEKAEVLESLGVVGDWTKVRRRSGWLSKLRGGRGRGK